MTGTFALRIWMDTIYDIGNGFYDRNMIDGDIREIGTKIGDECRRQK
jgi:hypothetical protein